MLDGPSLQIFLALAEHRHFGQAAERLGIAQSVASKRLARLEDALGTKLVDRGNRRRVALTRAGTLFLDEARAALDALTAAERSGQALARGAAGPLRIGYVFSAAMTGLLPGLVRALRSALPALDIYPSLMETPEQLGALAEARIDLAIVRPRPSWPERIDEIGRHREPVLVALGERMALAKRRSLRAEDLVSQTFLTPQFAEQVGLAQMVRDLARTKGLPEPAIRPTGDFITAAALAAAGEGIILAPASLSNLKLEGLTFRPIDDYAAEIELVLLARRETPAAIVDALAATLRGRQP